MSFHHIRSRERGKYGVFIIYISSVLSFSRLYKRHPIHKWLSLCFKVWKNKKDVRYYWNMQWLKLLEKIKKRFWKQNFRVASVTDWLGLSRIYTKINIYHHFFSHLKLLLRGSSLTTGFRLIVKDIILLLENLACCDVLTWQEILVWMPSVKKCTLRMCT